MHRKVRSYLQIKQDITISFECAYNNKCSSNLVEKLSTSESTPVSFTSNTVDNQKSFKEPKIL